MESSRSLSINHTALRNLVAEIENYSVYKSPNFPCYTSEKQEVRAAVNYHTRELFKKLREAINPIILNNQLTLNDFEETVQKVIKSSSEQGEQTTTQKTAAQNFITHTKNIFYISLYAGKSDQKEKVVSFITADHLAKCGELGDFKRELAFQILSHYNRQNQRINKDAHISDEIQERIAQALLKEFETRTSQQLLIENNYLKTMPESLKVETKYRLSADLHLIAQEFGFNPNLVNNAISGRQL